jgi:hypothetical protein
MQDLVPKNPVRYRAAQLQADAGRMEGATASLRLEGGQVVSKRTEVPAVRAVPMPVSQSLLQPRKIDAALSRSAKACDNTETSQALVAAGYCRTGGTSKVDLFKGSSEIASVYMTKGKTISVVVHPDARARAQVALQHLGTMGEAYHNSNMTGYPKRMHTGGKPIAYGYPVTFETAGALREFLIAFDCEN